MVSKNKNLEKKTDSFDSIPYTAPAENIKQNNNRLWYLGLAIALLVGAALGYWYSLSGKTAQEKKAFHKLTSALKAYRDWQTKKRDTNDALGALQSLKKQKVAAEAQGKYAISNELKAKIKDLENDLKKLRKEEKAAEHSYKLWRWDNPELTKLLDECTHTNFVDRWKEQCARWWAKVCFWRN